MERRGCDLVRARDARESENTRDRADRGEVVDALLTQFLAHVPPPITEARELAQRMARLTGGPRIAASLDNSGDLPV